MGETGVGGSDDDDDDAPPQVENEASDDESEGAASENDDDRLDRLFVSHTARVRGEVASGKGRGGVVVERDDDERPPLSIEAKLERVGTTPSDAVTAISMIPVLVFCCGSVGARGTRGGAFARILERERWHGERRKK